MTYAFYILSALWAYGLVRSLYRKRVETAEDFLRSFDNVLSS